MQSHNPRDRKHQDINIRNQSPYRDRHKNFLADFARLSIKPAFPRPWSRSDEISDEEAYLDTD